MPYSDSRYRSLFRSALRIRLVEEEIVRLYPTDKIQSPIHLSIGQEAVAAGVCEPLSKNDLVFINYRGHAFYLAKGGNLPLMMAELYGRASGICRGKGGSMHLAAPQVGVMGASAVVASTIPQAVGAALADKVLRRERLCVVSFGDGATEQGVYHESLNFASLHRLPVLFLCENNKLAVHASLQERHSYSIQQHSQSYGVESHLIEEGWDFVKIADVTREVASAIRRDGRPRLIEIITCRYKEHVGPGEDYNAGYRTHNDVKAWMAKDPLCIDTALISELRPELDAEIADAVAFAEAGPLPDPSDLLADVI